MSQANETYHARIDGTERNGEVFDGSVNKSRLSVHRKIKYASPSIANLSVNGTANDSNTTYTGEVPNADETEGVA